MIRRIRHWWLRNFGAFEVRDELTGERTIWRWKELDEASIDRTEGGPHPRWHPLRGHCRQRAEAAHPPRLQTQQEMKMIEPMPTDPLERRLALLLNDCAEEGWDSYGGAAYTRQMADAFVQRIANGIAPMVVGGTCLEMTIRDGDAEGVVSIDFDAEGRITNVFLQRPDRGELEWELDTR